ncbi:MAG: polymerase, partial [Nocardioidaceae bacterium]|nr:polymerase [Nocardioidaceae bacterium]
APVGHNEAVHLALDSHPDGARIATLDAAGHSYGDDLVVSLHDLPAEVARRERHRPRWVWESATRWYPALLAAGVRVERSVELRLCHVILRNSALTAGSALATARPGPWDATPGVVVPGREEQAGLFDVVSQPRPLDVCAEFASQVATVQACDSPGPLRLLLAAESAGALVAVEIQHAGLPWDAALHDRLLTDRLGPRPLGGERPAKLEALAVTIRETLGAPDLNPDSPADVLKALRRAELTVTTTRSRELEHIDHPVIAPLLTYKKLSRLHAANGWQWLEAWIRDGRFHPVYVPGGVVTGRWAASGGGALQLPKEIRGAVVADPGWKLVVADAAQLEPRILAGMSGDRRMTEAGQDGDLYEGIVAAGAVSTRAEAKLALLGAMYGARSGDSGRLLPRLTTAFPDAIALVEAAARAGERGEVVSTRLGRSSPAPGEEWRDRQRTSFGPDATKGERASAAAESRSWGRFTRNFIIQGTGAEWALCWMAGLRNLLWALGQGGLAERPQLVFFLHDELVVHAPAHLAEEVAVAMRQAAHDAGQMLFSGSVIDFPITVAIVDSYAEAK